MAKDTSHCLGDKHDGAVVLRDGREIWKRWSHDLSGLAISGDSRFVIDRTDRGEQFIDSRSGASVARPADYDPAGETLAHGLFEGSTDLDPASRFLHEVVVSNRHELVRQISTAERLRLVAALSNSRNIRAMMVLAEGDPDALAAAAEAVAGWREHDRVGPAFLDWRKPDPRWQLQSSVVLREGRDISYADVERFCAVKHLPAVTTLEWRTAGLGSRAAVLLAGSPNLDTVRVLDLSGWHMGDLGAVALANSPHLGALAVLALRNNDIGDAGATALAKCLKLEPRARVDLGVNRIGDDAASAWAERAQDVGYLVLGDNHLSQTGRDALAGAGFREGFGPHAGGPTMNAKRQVRPKGRARGPQTPRVR